MSDAAETRASRTDWSAHPWMGVFAATLCPFHKDESIDEEGLRRYIRGLCAAKGLKGLVPNGHTGEIMSLRESERARVTRIVAEEVRRSMGVRECGSATPTHAHTHPHTHTLVISGICGEGSLSAIDHALAAKEAGAVIWNSAIDYCTNMNANGGTYGYTDWRLPNAQELNSLVCLGYSSPALCNTAGTGKWTANDPFTNVGTANEYWCSTIYAADGDHRTVMWITHGFMKYRTAGDATLFWPVRGGQ